MIEQNYEVAGILRKAKQMQAYGQPISDSTMRDAVRGALEASQLRQLRWGELNLKKRATESDIAYKEAATTAEKTRLGMEAERIKEQERVNREQFGISQAQLDIGRSNVGISKDQQETNRRRQEQEEKSQKALGTAGYIMAGSSLYSALGTTGTTAAVGTTAPVTTTAAAASPTASLGATFLSYVGIPAAAYVGGKIGGEMGTWKVTQAVTPWGGEKTERRVGGFMGGMAAGAAVTAWSGPGMIVGAVVGGIVGYMSSK